MISGVTLLVHSRTVSIQMVLRTWLGLELKKERHAFIDFITRRLFVLPLIGMRNDIRISGLAAVVKAATPEGEPDFTFPYYTVPYFVLYFVLYSTY
jgi:hypothetical protein